MNKLYNILIDENFEKSLKEFQNSLSPLETICSTTVVKDWFVIATRKLDSPANSQHRNLLLEEAARFAKKIT